MRVIITKYHGPANVRGSRIIADDGDGHRIIISCPDDLNHDDSHKKAATTLRNKMGLKGQLIGGHIKGGMAWVFTCGATVIE